MIEKTFKHYNELFSPMIKKLIDSNVKFYGFKETVRWCFVENKDISIFATCGNDNIIYVNLLAVIDSYSIGDNPPNFNEINYDGRSGEKMLCFFTNEGLHRCEPIIKKMLDILRKNGAVIDTLKYIVEIPVTDSNIVYRDQYQAIVYWEG